MKKYFLMLLLSVFAIGAINAQTIMDVAGIKGDSYYPFAKGVHKLNAIDFEDVKYMINLGLNPPEGYTPFFETAVEKMPGLASPKFVEFMLNGNSISTITIKEYGKGQVVQKILRMEGAKIGAYSLGSENYDEAFTIRADKVWYEEPLKKGSKIGYDFKNKTPLK